MVKYGIEYHLVQVKCTMSITYHKTPAKEITMHQLPVHAGSYVCVYIRKT